MRSRLKRWSGTLVMIFLMLVLLYCIAGVETQKRTGELFYPFSYRPVVILSGSMEDTLKTGAVVLVKKTKNVEVEDIIFFISDEGVPVIHRCVEKLNDGNLVTKGDANSHTDFEPVSLEQVEGKVVCVMNWLAPIMIRKQGIFRGKIPCLSVRRICRHFVFILLLPELRRISRRILRMQVLLGVQL